MSSSVGIWYTAYLWLDRLILVRYEQGDDHSGYGRDDDLGPQDGAFDTIARLFPWHEEGDDVAVEVDAEGDEEDDTERPGGDLADMWLRGDRDKGKENGVELFVQV